MSGIAFVLQPWHCDRSVVPPVSIVGIFGFAGPLYAFALIATAMLIVLARYLDPPILPPKPMPQTHKARTPLWRSSNLTPLIGTAP
ncbi:hypothetical protein IVA95_27965 [Bradyrhizobium sp. 157]|uniref:hypothetical protein n=1 Tax=Bradyrhizobium sp. 157 TaxID=2782631 RepID=UPI001FFA14E4|nr:hypothetical protein [Bradyrhizobium sp. 157]MCK1641311.1 hypothetical protein [Bradyrhizobium sp. 157]